jgi:hypothetical protein
MAKRRTIGTNPLDAVVPEPREIPPARAPGPAPKVDKDRLTVHLPVELIERAKNAVYWTPGLTLASLAEEALRQALAELEAARGAPFPPRERQLSVGRPLR